MRRGLGLSADRRLHATPAVQTVVAGIAVRRSIGLQVQRRLYAGSSAVAPAAHGIQVRRHPQLALFRRHHVVPGEYIQPPEPPPVVLPGGGKKSVAPAGKGKRPQNQDMRDLIDLIEILTFTRVIR